MPPPRRQNSAVDALVEALRHDIRSGKLRPGQRIDLDEWGEGMGASRTPVRLALERLEAEGFVKLSGRRGATIIDVTLNHIEDVLCTRLVLDATLGRVGARNITQQDLAVLESLLEQIEAIKLPEEHAKMVDPAQRFHAQLFHAAGAPMMHRLAMQSVHHTDVFLSSMWFTNRRIADVGKAYFAQLYAACLARDVDRVSELIRGLPGGYGGSGPTRSRTDRRPSTSFRACSPPRSSCSCKRSSTRATTRWARGNAALTAGGHRRQANVSKSAYSVKDGRGASAQSFGVRAGLVRTRDGMIGAH